jgi:hypothetical protein
VPVDHPLRIVYPIAATAVIAGVTQAATKPVLGWSLIAAGVVLALITGVVDALTTSARRRKLRRARNIVSSLRGEGDRLVQGGMTVAMQVASPDERGAMVMRFVRKVEKWRTTVGKYLNRSPFKPGTGQRVLTKHGDRLTDPLERLRQIESDVEKHVED